MSDKLIKQITYGCVATLLFVVIISIFVTKNNYVYSKDDTIFESVTEVTKMHDLVSNESESINSFLTIVSDNNNITKQLMVDDKSLIGEDYIFVPYTNGAKNIVVEEKYTTKSIELVFNDIKTNSTLTDIVRVKDGIEYKNTEFLKKDKETGYNFYISSKGEKSQNVFATSANQLTWNQNDEEVDPLIGYGIKNIVEGSITSERILLQLDRVYVPLLYYDETGIYISLQKPSDVYDKVLVIDAGHGGKDSGAIGIADTYFEKDLNLAILNEIKALLLDEDIKVYYTRTNDETIYLQPRVSLANEINADLFLSIHFNASENETASGSEVLYNEKDTHKFSSLQFAKHCFDEVYKVTKNMNRGLVEGNEMVIIGNANMPVALVEVGFITNKKELDFVTSEENQKKIAKAIVNGIKDSFEELEGEAQ